MSWKSCKYSNPIAKKEYRCQASDYIDNAVLDECDYEPEDFAAIAQANAENNMIITGARYYKIKGLYDGNPEVYRARQDLHDICVKYDLYDEFA